MADKTTYPRGGIRPKAIAGWLYFCGHCGDPIGSGKYCKDCRTVSMREKVDELNAEINGENIIE